ncbi:MAG: prepilin-type N-terminal cleavage/methylation domain-containing protein [Gammaproteobacteria bacterium]|nr:prepilin-type N-terminal cleavage/methylation domain-containing protein [Gammaproteobacteria bacterium]
MHSAEWNRQRAFTLIELLIALVIVGALLSVAVPTYQEYVERARRTTAIKDIAEISLVIERHLSQTGAYPNSLDDLNPAPPSEDPWGNAYQYLGIEVDPRPNQGAVRKDKNLNPLNSDYDLYSMGPDGQSQKQLTAAKARDDIVRAGNGGFIGLASEH